MRKNKNIWKFKNESLQLKDMFRYVMESTQSFENIKSNKVISNKELHFIMNNINKQECLMCNSGRVIELEKAIFLSDKELMIEGIYDSVIVKIQWIYDKIKECLRNIFAKAPNLIRVFCERLKSNPIIRAIRERYKLDRKNIKKYIY